MPHIIRLPEPCHEDWNAMTPVERGRHCAQCAKTVVDFTGWAPQEIVFYLRTHAGACGRFRADQLNVTLPSPEDFVREIVRMPFSFIRRVAAIFLFVFGLMAGTSCNQTGKVTAQQQPVDSTHTTADTTADRKIMGGMDISVRIDTPAVPRKGKQSVKGPDQPQVLGEPAVVEPQPEVLGGAPVVEVPPQPVVQAVPAQREAGDTAAPVRHLVGKPALPPAPDATNKRRRR